MALGRRYFRTVLWGTGIRARVVGREHIPTAATLFAGNHISYMDIAVVHSLVPASFVAKAEVGRMPIFGLMTRVNGSILVDRETKNPKTLLRQIGGVERRLAQGHHVVLFAEGTSTDDGSEVKPFKEALFRGLKTQPGRAVVPFTLALQGGNREAYAWYGHDVLADLLRLFGYRRVEIHVVFHPAIYWQEDSAGSSIAKRAEEVVRATHAGLTQKKGEGALQ